MVASASSATCPANNAMEGISTSTKVRPTQTYYVPRPVQESKEEKIEKPKEKSSSPKEQKKNAGAQLYTPPQFRNNQGQMPPTPKLRPLMDIQIDKVSLFADTSSSSESSRKSPDAYRKSPDVENRRKSKTENYRRTEKREQLFPKIISVPSSSSAPGSSKTPSPPREGFSSNMVPPPVQPAVKDGCICEREKAHVACKRCGYECSGRLAIVCPIHPMQMNLMDLTACPNPLCHSVQLFEVARK